MEPAKAEKKVVPAAAVSVSEAGAPAGADTAAGAANDTSNDAPPTAVKPQAKKAAQGNVNALLGDDDLFEGLGGGDEETVSLLDGDDDEGGEGDEEVAGEGLLDGLDDADEVPTGNAEDGEEETPEVGVMTIFNVKCLRCTHLIPELTDETNPKGKEFKNCHFEKGNTECPAQWATIVVGIPVDKYVSSILEAEESGDSEKLAAIYAKLASKDEAQQAEVHRRLAQARKAAAEATA